MSTQIGQNNKRKIEIFLFSIRQIDFLIFKLFSLNFFNFNNFKFHTFLKKNFLFFRKSRCFIIINKKVFFLFKFNFQQNSYHPFILCIISWISEFKCFFFTFWRALKPFLSNWLIVLFIIFVVQRRIRFIYINHFFFTFKLIIK